VDLSAELQACLKEFTADGAIEIRENGGRVTLFSGLAWEVRGATAKPLLHLWSENYNLTRRVLAITEHSEERLSLAVERFGRAKPDRLEFIRLEFEHSARALSREAFCGFLRRLLTEQFPDECVESLCVAPDLEHSLSGIMFAAFCAAALRSWRFSRSPLENPPRRSTAVSRSRCCGCIVRGAPIAAGM